MNQTNTVDFTADHDEPNTAGTSHADDLITAIQELIVRLRESNPIKAVQ